MSATTNRGNHPSYHDVCIMVFCHHYAVIRYDRLHLITLLAFVYCTLCNAHKCTYGAKHEEGVRVEVEGSCNGEVGRHIGHTQGGCPVFRVTWLNGIALAHSCPLRRNGRLASRFFSAPSLYVFSSLSLCLCLCLDYITHNLIHFTKLCISLS